MPGTVNVVIPEPVNIVIPEPVNIVIPEPVNIVIPETASRLSGIQGRRAEPYGFPLPRE